MRVGIAAARLLGKHLGRPRRPVDIAKAKKLMGGGLGLRATARELEPLRRALEGMAQKPHREEGRQVRGRTGATSS